MPPIVMMQLGEFQFSISTVLYQTLDRQAKYNWQSQSRLNGSLAWQYTAESEESISLDGVIYPQFKGGGKQVELMRTEAEKGELSYVNRCVG